MLLVGKVFGRLDSCLVGSYNIVVLNSYVVMKEGS